MQLIATRHALRWILPLLLLVGLVTSVAWAADATHPVVAIGLAALAALAAMGTASFARSAWTTRTDRAERTPLVTDPGELSRPWTAARLKQTLLRHLEGEQVLLVANREPAIHNHAADGSIVVQHPASGLVTALEPVMRACSGTWIAHGSGSADRETVGAYDRVIVPAVASGEGATAGSYSLRRVWLSEEEEKGHYDGFSNEGLWPLCHIAHARPIFRNEDFAHYERVNRKFADAVCAEAETDDPIVLVQDYHFALAPRMIRERLPRATIITFWHIPWPNPESYGICPWHDELLEGLLGSSIVGFHTQQHCNNFLDAIDRYLEARIDREHVSVIQQRRETLVRPYPISIEWPNRWVQQAPSVAECRASVLAELGLPADALLGVGVDRVDYTKGIEERFLAVERLLQRYPRYRGKFTFVQLGAPSRTRIARYRDLGVEVERVVERINARFGSGSYRPIILLGGHHEPPAVFRHLRAADLCYVSSLHDGMNLVAKEFIAARDDERGVLVLSEFTGAARELVEALIVNPYDLDEASSAMAAALTMRPEEQQERMRAMREFVSEWNVYRWAGRMLVDASRLRQAERLSGRITRHAGASTADKLRSRPPPIRVLTPWRSESIAAATPLPRPGRGAQDTPGRQRLRGRRRSPAA